MYVNRPLHLINVLHFLDDRETKISPTNSFSISIIELGKIYRFIMISRKTWFTKNYKSEE